MKNFFKKFAMLLIVPALAAGILFCLCGAGRRLPAGAYINGVYVGGLSASAAAERVREDIVADLYGRQLKICSGGHVYAYSYPEISFKDDVKKVAESVRGAGSYGIELCWYLNGLDAVVSGICAAEYQPLREPSAHFNGGEGEAFLYDGGCDGAMPDGARLRQDILQSLAKRRYGGDFAQVNLNVARVPRSHSLQKLKERTARLSAYTTYFDCENSPRVSNIRLAGQKISGCILPAGGSFSFNERVGARTEANGFKRAKIIEGGRFVYGTGGGVCQVSTTLYNAALLAGLKVTEYHPHSLSVGYVSPSRDAMVSGTYSDLKFCNPAAYPVYIRVLTGLYYVRCEIYGLPDGAEYSLSSSVTGGEDGAVESECYLTVRRGGSEYTRLLRKDRYLPAKDNAEPQAGEQKAAQ